jgi:hypothetical protein
LGPIDGFFKQDLLGLNLIQGFFSLKYSRLWPIPLWEGESYTKPKNTTTGKKSKNGWVFHQLMD